MNIDHSYYLIVFAIYTVSYLIKGIAGFGDPLLSNPLLSIFLENKIISPANLLISMPINTYMAWNNRNDFSIKKVIPIVISLLIGIIPGTLLLKYATSWILKVSLGLLIIMIGINMLSRSKDETGKNNKFIMAFICFCSGVTAGLYGINLFVISYIERTSDNRNEFRGNLCFVFLIESIFRLATYFASGIMNIDIILLALIAAPGVIAGLYMATKIDQKLREETIRRIIVGIFIIGGLSIVVKTMLHLFS
ncbi:MAG TPA: sulfite exporter TauE/SafE family protein [Anaerovoracaceae bacterium]|nr:sulfite exporter TauE/SafE family protein [Anaerovoracaceae bacterium]